MTAKTKTDKEIEKLLEFIPQHYVDFVDYHTKGHSPVACLRLSGMSGPNEKDWEREAKGVMNAPAVKMYIQAMKRKVSEGSVMTLEDADKKLTDIATTDAADILEIGTKDMPIYDAKGELVTTIEQPDVQLIDKSEMTPAQLASIKSIKVVKGELHIELHDPVKAMDMLIKRRSGYREVKDVNVNSNVHVFAAVDDNGRGPKSE